jgi:hypothetical protein
MQRLLISLAEQPPELRLPQLEQQQHRVDNARELYETARNQYMHEVLDVIFYESGDRRASATSDPPDLQPPRVQ